MPIGAQLVSITSFLVHSTYKGTHIFNESMVNSGSALQSWPSGGTLDVSVVHIMPEPSGFVHKRISGVHMFVESGTSMLKPSDRHSVFYNYLT